MFFLTDLNEFRPVSTSFPSWSGIRIFPDDLPGHFKIGQFVPLGKQDCNPQPCTNSHVPDGVEKEASLARIEDEASMSVGIRPHLIFGWQVDNKPGISSPLYEMLRVLHSYPPKRGRCVARPSRQSNQELRSNGYRCIINHIPSFNGESQSNEGLWPFIIALYY